MTVTSRAIERVRAMGGAVARAAIEHGLPPAVTGYRGLPRRSVSELDECVVVHAPAVAANPLPINVGHRDLLPGDAGWWGHSMRDVPTRAAGPTIIGTVRDARVVGYRNEQRDGDYVPAIIAGGYSIEARELRMRSPHAARLRGPADVQRFERATWVVERVYHNHSHWLNAHLPKLVLLRDRDELDDVLLPDDLTPLQVAAMARCGIDDRSLRRFDPDRPIHVDELRIVATDRFRPELLRATRDALLADGQIRSRAGGMRPIYISRSKASRRRLVNEEAVLGALGTLGIEALDMEDLAPHDQFDLMADADVVIGPHGAGLTNMIGSRPGTHVVEIADPAFPNPNFYSMAVALDHPYAYVQARSVGRGNPIDRDLIVDPDAVVGVVERVLAGV